MHTARTVSITRQQSLDHLIGESSELAASWHRCSGKNPFRDHAWLHSWWSHLSQEDSQAMVLLANDESSQIIGILPLYRTQSHSQTWRSWGDGNTCSDHQSLICLGEHRTHVAELFAKELIRLSSDGSLGWSQLLFDGVLAGDVAMGNLADALQRHGASIDCHSRMNLWFKQGCENWETFLNRQSKRLRSKLRQLLRNFDNDEDWNLVRHDHSSSELHEAVDQLIDLHQKRWNSAGQPGTYQHSQTRVFLHKFVESYRGIGTLYLPVLRYQNQPVAAELHLIGSDGRFHCYTSGVDLGRADLTPGLMLNALTLRYLHQVEAPGVDFMRGDEEYKARLSADSVPVLQMRVSAPTWRGRATSQCNRMEMNIRQWVRKQLHRPLVQTFSLGEAFSEKHASSPCHVLPKPDLVARELSCVGS